MNTFGNVLTAMITPFTPTGEVDYEAAVQLAHYLLAHGSDGLVVAGTTGEGAVMTAAEKLQLFTVIVNAVGSDVPIIANTGSYDTRESVELTAAAEKTGVSAVMAVVPYYNKPTQEGCYRHFSAIAEATSLPVVLYNVPGRTSLNLDAKTVIRLAHDYDNIVAVKEASGNLVQISQIARNMPEGFMIYSGDDSLTLPILAVGGTGVISVAAHLIGTEMNDMIRAFKAGHVQEAQRLHCHLLPFMQGMFFTASPIPVKEAMNLIGQPGGDFRLPLVHASEVEKETIRTLLREYQLV